MREVSSVCCENARTNDGKNPEITIPKSEVCISKCEVRSQKSEVRSLKIPLAFRTIQRCIQSILFFNIDRNLTALFNQIKINLNKC